VDAVVRLESQPGQFVVQGTVLAVAEGDKLSQTRLEDEFRREVISIGVRRILLQDPEFAIAQIVEIALRAMSPGVNDPNTAVTCVNWLADSLRILAQNPVGNPAHLDSQGNIRVIEKVNDFERIVAAAGTFANMPVGTPHSFTNESGRPARMLISVAPAGLQIVGDDLFVTRVELPPRFHRNRALDELNVAVGHHHVTAARMVASGRRDVAMVGRFHVATQAAVAARGPWVLRGIRRHDCVEHCDRFRAP
jgi:hypothetical protein